MLEKDIIPIHILANFLDYLIDYTVVYEALSILIAAQYAIPEFIQKVQISSKYYLKH